MFDDDDDEEEDAGNSFTASPPLAIFVLRAVIYPKDTQIPKVFFKRIYSRIVARSECGARTQLLWDLLRHGYFAHSIILQWGYAGPLLEEEWEVPL